MLLLATVIFTYLSFQCSNEANLNLYGTLTEERMAKLNEMDFTWDCRRSGMRDKIDEASVEYTLADS